MFWLRAPPYADKVDFLIFWHFRALKKISPIFFSFLSTYQSKGKPLVF